MKKINLKPYDGLGKIKLYSSYETCKEYLKVNKIPFIVEKLYEENDELSDKWKVIVIQECISLFFGNNNKLFKIYCVEGYEGSLPNGININTYLKEALLIDKTLCYNDDGEDYESNNGYWIEDNLDTGKLFSITIFIKELLDDEIFYQYKW